MIASRRSIATTCWQSELETLCWVERAGLHLGPPVVAP